MGERLRAQAPRNWGKNVTLIASLSTEGLGAAMSVEGATDGAAFETYVKHFLVPTLKEGQVVVMDNLSAHKGERVRELIEAKGCELIYLPPYSPDFNPIEYLWKKVKKMATHLKHFPDFTHLQTEVDKSLLHFAQTPHEIMALVTRYCDSLGALAA